MNRQRLMISTLVALGVSVASAGCGVLSNPETRSLTARFDRTVGLYEKSDVRILGVRIGEVTAIVPEGKTVRVEMTYDAKYKVPDDAKAVIVAPSIVSDRYVQLTPAWTEGPLLADGTKLELDRTSVPVELDAIYSALDQLNLALGPKGANKNGALSDLVKVGADNLEGNGALLNSTLADLSKAVGTLANQRDDLFGTVANLQDFTTTIADSDATVREFNADLAEVANQLNGQKQSLADAVRNLSVALGEVASFVRENQKDLTANVKDLASVTTVLVKQKTALEEFLDNTPVALSNLQLAYNPSSGTLDTRDNNGNGSNGPLGQLCGILVAGGAPGDVCDPLNDLISQIPGGPPALPGPPVAPASTGRDMSLGGILAGGAS